MTYTVLRDAHEIIARRGIVAGNSVTARTIGENPAWRTGVLPQPWKEQFDTASRADLIEYVVYSYATPIAWVLRYNNAVIIPDVKYSRTTSRHQSIARRGLHRDGYSPAAAPRVGELALKHAADLKRLKRHLFTVVAEASYNAASDSLVPA